MKNQNQRILQFEEVIFFFAFLNQSKPDFYFYKNFKWSRRQPNKTKVQDLKEHLILSKYIYELWPR